MVQAKEGRSIDGGHGRLTPAQRVLLVGLVTALLYGVPLALVALLRSLELIPSTVVSFAVALSLALLLATVLCGVWQRSTASQDLLFSELSIWGFLRRVHNERRIATLKRLTSGFGTADPKGAAAVLEELAQRLDRRDPQTHGHSRRVARHARTIARRLGLPEPEVARITAAAAIHDVGKLFTPLEILRKPGRLSDEEFEVIKRHPVDGAELSKPLGDPLLTAIIRHHHERIDGSGYPDRLVGSAIPLGARIIAVADTFDAITSSRPYRLARPHKAAIDVLRAEAGTKLDAEVVRAFCAHYAGRRPLAVWTFGAATLLEAASARASSLLGGIAAPLKAAAVVSALGATVVAAVSPRSFLASPKTARVATVARVQGRREEGWRGPAAAHTDPAAHRRVSDLRPVQPATPGAASRPSIAADQEGRGASRSVALAGSRGQDAPLPCCRVRTQPAAAQPQSPASATAQPTSQTGADPAVPPTVAAQQQPTAAQPSGSAPGAPAGSTTPDHSEGEGVGGGPQPQQDQRSAAADRGASAQQEGERGEKQGADAVDRGTDHELPAPAAAEHENGDKGEAGAGSTAGAEGKRAAKATGD